MQFEVTPGPKRDGFTLNSPVLLFPLWYPTFDAAIGYARFLGRHSGCEVRVSNCEGEQVDLIQFRMKRDGTEEKRWLGGRSAQELRASNLELRQQIDLMTRLEWELLETNEKEHRRFGWDLHEDLGQQLAGITILASLLAKQLESNCPDLGNELGALVGQLRDAISNTRNIARGLYPIGLENGGLVMVLEEFAAWITQVEGIPCEFRNEGPTRFKRPSVGFGDRVSSFAGSTRGNQSASSLATSQTPIEDEFEIPKESAIHFYRIAQEAVNYLLKTGEVRRITIKCGLVDSIPKLIVTGEGVGFGEPSMEGAGLMHSRARMIGAEISFEQAPVGGRSIVCALKGHQSS